MDAIFDGFICKEEIDKCRRSSNGKDNPLVYWFTTDVKDSSNNFGYTKYNFISALNAIKRTDFNWLTKNKDRLLDGNDINNAMAALAELCCYGYLVDAFGHDFVASIPTTEFPTPDFYLCNNTEEKIYIEVNAVQINGDELNALKEFNSHREFPKNQRIVIREHCVAPFGRKNASCITENVIHKLCQIKNNEKQFDDNLPCVLWVDLQGQHVNILHKRAFNSCPITT